MESTACNLCGSPLADEWLSTTDRWTGEPFDILRCRHCGLRCTHPSPTPDELARYYPPPTEPAWLTRILRRWLRRHRARWSAAGLSPGRALEIGCGDGWMLEALRDAGWDVVGTERSAASAAYARSRGLDVRVREVADCQFPPASFDLIILWHTLEHLHDPLATLTGVRRLIRPSGRLVVAVPNVGGWQAQVAGRRWYHLNVPRHLYHFEAVTLERLLAQARFEVGEWAWTSPAYELRGWWELLACITPDAVSYTLAPLVLPLAAVVSVIAGYARAGAAVALRAVPVDAE